MTIVNKIENPMEVDNNKSIGKGIIKQKEKKI